MGNADGSEQAANDDHASPACLDITQPVPTAWPTTSGQQLRWGTTLQEARLKVSEVSWQGGETQQRFMIRFRPNSPSTCSLYPHAKTTGAALLARRHVRRLFQIAGCAGR